MRDVFSTWTFLPIGRQQKKSKILLLFFKIRKHILGAIQAIFQVNNLPLGKGPKGWGRSLAREMELDLLPKKGVKFN